VLVEGDERLFNQYGMIVVNPAKHPHVKAAIAAYRIRGERLFIPNAGQ